MIHVDQQIAGRHRELSNIGVFHGDCADLLRRRSEPGNVASGDRGQVGRYLDAHDLVKRLLRRDQQHTPLATTEVDERIFARVDADPLEHPGSHPQRRRKIADRKLAGFGIADAEIAWLDRAGGVSAMLRIELRVGFRRVDPVCKLGHGGTPAETLEAIANAP